LLVARLAWRIVNPSPPLELTRWGRLSQAAAKVGHYVLYALLLLVPFAGIMVQLKRGHRLPILGLAEFGPPWPADRATAGKIIRAHEFLANALLILAGLHALAALIHYYALRDRTLARMLPAVHHCLNVVRRRVQPLRTFAAAAAPARSMARSLITARNRTPRLASATARSAEWQ